MYYGAVEYVTEHGIMIGVGDNRFDPAGDTTRGALATMLARFDGQELPQTNPWYQAGMDWAVEAGVSDGTMPDQAVTRVQAVTMMWRLVGEPEAEADLSDYTDAAKIPSWGRQAVEWALASGIMLGSNHQLTPTDPATRAEIAQLMMKFCQSVQG